MERGEGGATTNRAAMSRGTIVKWLGDGAGVIRYRTASLLVLGTGTVGTTPH